MRDYGFDFCWADKFKTNLFARGFEWQDSLPVDAITSFEAIEHFVNPMTEIDTLLKVSKTLVFSTELLPSPLPKPGQWWYFGLEHG